jgi:hypothetical protein
MKKRIISIAAIVIAIITLAIVLAISKINIGDGGLISEDPCGPDCFFGITPAISSQEDVEVQLKKYKLRWLCKIEDFYGNLSYTCDDSFVIYIDRNSNLVSLIGFTPKIDIKLESVINKYGAPDFLVAYEAGTTPEHPLTTTRLYFNKYNLCIDVSEQAGNFIQISPELVIRNVGYSQEFPELNHSSFVKQLWQGYGKYYQAY